MGDIINFSNENKINTNDSVVKNNQLIEMTDELLASTRSKIEQESTINIPFSEAATLGMAIGSFLPSLMPLAQNLNGGETLYRIANLATGDTLKLAKNGNFWGAMFTPDGKSKFAQLQEVNMLSEAGSIASVQLIVVAAILYSVEKKLDNIVDLEKQILSFLETEKESAIEADAETLMDLIQKYKHNWDNSHFVSSGHKLVMDIQRSARQHITSYQKKLEEDLKSNPLIISQSEVSSSVKNINKKFEYYRLSLYTFSMASLIEVLLSGNLSEANLMSVKSEIEKLSSAYVNMFGKCLKHLKKMTESSIETNVLKGIGEASKAIGGFFGSIPFIKDGPVDEFLQDGGKQLNKSAKDMETDSIKTFKKLENPHTSIFTERLEEINSVHNHVEDICLDEDNIYLVVS